MKNQSDRFVGTAGDPILLQRRLAEQCRPEWCLHLEGKNYGLPIADIRQDAGETHALEPQDRSAVLLPAWYADEVWDPSGPRLRFPALSEMAEHTEGGRYLRRLMALEQDAATKWKNRPAIEPVAIYSGPAPDHQYWPGGDVAWWILYRYNDRMILVARPPRPVGGSGS
jgi:hypothetical protein